MATRIRRAIGRVVTYSYRYLLCGAAIEAVLLALLAVGDLGPQVPLLWSLLLAAFAAYGVAVIGVLRGWCGSLRLVLAIGLLFRVTLLWSDPGLSDDHYRYVWDGRVQLAGINPFLYAPDDEALRHLRDDGYEGINHKEIPTVYPPLTQLFFRLVCTASPTAIAMKVGILLCEAGLVLALVALLRRRHADPRRVLLYVWNPLAIVETAGSGHIDALAVMLTVLSLCFALAGRRHLAVWALAGGTLAKLIPILLVPVLWRHFGLSSSTSRAVRWLHPSGRLPLLWLPLWVVVGYLAYLGPGVQLFEGLKTYASKWRFNDAAFTLLYNWLRQPELAWDDDALMLARQVSAVLLALAVLWTVFRVEDPLQAAFNIFGVYLLLSPTLHPWYLIWVLPFLPFFPRPAWLLFSGLVFLAYHVLTKYSIVGLWEEESWTKWGQYGPLYLLLVWDGLRRRRQRKVATHREGGGEHLAYRDV